MSNLRPNDPYSSLPFTRLRDYVAPGEHDNVVLLTRALRRRLLPKREFTTRAVYRALVRRHKREAAANLEATRLAAITLQVLEL